MKFITEVLGEDGCGHKGQREDCLREHVNFGWLNKMTLLTVHERFGCRV